MDPPVDIDGQAAARLAHMFTGQPQQQEDRFKGMPAA